jgi:uncharacterized protein (DUF1697 family)
MKYVALLRGINVGGNNIIKMTDLQKVFETAGYTNVKTVIQSGNVIFESRETDKEIITGRLEAVLSKAFQYSSKVVIRSHKEMTRIISEVPKIWNQKNDVRSYILFIKEPVTENEVASEVEVTEGIDSIKTGIGVVYMTTKMEGLTKSKFSKIIGKKVYKDVTMRNYKTSHIILEIMDGTLSKESRHE